MHVRNCFFSRYPHFSGVLGFRIHEFGFATEGHLVEWCNKKAMYSMCASGVSVSYAWCGMRIIVGVSITKLI